MTVLNEMVETILTSNTDLLLLYKQKFKLKKHSNNKHSLSGYLISSGASEQMYIDIFLIIQETRDLKTSWSFPCTSNVSQLIYVIIS